MTASGAQDHGKQGRENTAAVGLGAAVFAAVAFSLIVPRGAAWLLPLLALTAIWACRPSYKELREVLTGSAAVAALLLFFLYAFINATWSLDRAEAFAKVGLAFGYLLLVLAAMGALGKAGPQEGRRLGLALVGGAAAGCLIFAFEVLSHQALEATLQGLWTATPRRLEINDLNRNAGLLTLAFWPVLLAAWRLEGPRLRLALGGTFLAAALIGVGASIHETSMIGLAASALVFAVALWRPALVRWGMIALWCAAFVLVVPTVTAAYKAELHLAEWLPNSMRARVVLWNQTAARLPEAPLLGIGVRSTRARDAMERDHAVMPEGFPYALRTGRHAHNFFLQTWYEMGLAGVLLFAAAGVAILQALARLPERAQAFAYAQFAAFMVIAAAAWGMWQSWLLAGIGLGAMHMRVALLGEHDPEKWEPVFGQDHAQTKS